MKKLILLLLVKIFLSIPLLATHNYAGEIVFRQISQFEIEATVITYTAMSAVAADRDTLLICWGDGQCQAIGRTNGPNNQGEVISEYYKKNEYKKVHTYPNSAVYLMTVTDPNRNANILNLNFPNSGQTPFEIATQVLLQDLNFNDPNNSPVLLQPPIDAAFLGEPFLHTPNAFDIDGDSIAYELVTPLSAPNYQEITAIAPGPENMLTLNEETGLIVWDAPQMEGAYTIAYMVKSYRNGQMIDYVIRDMTIEVVENPGNAPEVILENITGNEEIIFVELGDTVQLNIEVNDIDFNQEILITSTCGLYDFFNNNAVFTAISNGTSGTATFEWIVKEEHLRQQPYQVVVKGEDDTDAHVKSKLAVVRYQIMGISTGTIELSTAQDLTIFPNPVTDGVLNSNFRNQEALPDRFRIYDSIGCQMQSGEITSASFQLRVDRLASGVYHLILEKDGQLISGTFMVQ